MKKIKQDIKNNSFSNIYLLYGEDDYMKKLYRDKLKTAIIGAGDDMNYNYYTNTVDVNKIISVSETLPFFSDRRLIIIEDAKYAEDSNDLAEYLKNAPSTSCFVFIEKKIDKRSKLFKTISKLGYAVEMNGLSEIEIMAFAKGLIIKSDIKIADNDIRYLISKIGTDMNTITNECIKLCSYVQDKGEITRKDIDDICITLLENKIFEMLDYVAVGKSNEALILYNNLIELRESPAKMMRLVSRHYTILYKLINGKKEHINDKDMASSIKIPPFALKKYLSQLSNYTESEILEILKECIDIEESFKTGKLDEQIGIELLIIKICNKNFMIPN